MSDNYTPIIVPWRLIGNAPMSMCCGTRQATLTGTYQKPASEEDELHRRFCRQLQSLEPGAVLVEWPVRELV